MRISHSLALVGSLQFGVSGPVDGHVYALRGPAGIVLIDAGGGTAPAKQNLLPRQIGQWDLIF